MSCLQTLCLQTAGHNRHVPEEVYEARAILPSLLNLEFLDIDLRDSPAGSESTSLSRYVPQTSSFQFHNSISAHTVQDLI